MFSNDEATWKKFQDATTVSGEKFWRLPCTDDYKDQIKSQIADIMNTGKNRMGRAISAAMFLKEFVGETPWVHLDIAGCAWNDESEAVDCEWAERRLRCGRLWSGCGVIRLREVI